MGKKRASAAKKKQVAKKKKLSSAYGVSVLKGSKVSRNNGVIDANFASPVDANNNYSSHIKNPIRTLANGDEGKAKTNNNSATIFNGNHQKKSADATMQAREKSGQRSRVNHSENDEFHRLHASSEERSVALQVRNDELRQRKKIRSQQQKKGWGTNFARPLVPNFAEATLTLAPKTTQELVDDATICVARGMSNIGQSVASNVFSATSGQSSLAAAAGLDWKLRAYETYNMQTKQSNAQQHPNNPYAAFESDSDDNEWTDNDDDKPNSVQRFQFQPASFSLQPDVSQSELDNEVDPDL